MNVNLFTPYPAQREFIDLYANSPHIFGVLVSPRGAGKTLLSINLALYWLLKNNNSKLGYITPIYSLGKEVFEIIQSRTTDLIESSNKSDLTIKFINGSSIKFLSADRADSVRGFRFHYLILDEVAYLNKQDIENAILPTLNPNGRKCLMISTPRGKNHFYEYYLKGQEGNSDYISYRIPLNECPYVKTELIEEARKSLPREVFRSEYEAEFTDSTNDVFLNLENRCILDEWTLPNRGDKYYAGVDTGLSSDYSVLTILNEAGRVVFVDRTNNDTIENIANRFIGKIKQYNVVGGYVESNGVGKGMYELMNKHSRGLKPFYTSQDSKMNAVRTLITDLDGGVLELPSKALFPYIYNELSAYTFKYSANGKISFSHPNGMNDDCVDSLWLANGARNQLRNSGVNAIRIGSISR
ncbi:terminase large subunit domain-containing protein [Shewanella sp.]|uniref:terminase large subunit domain-containing protein n=1 Tax=Shewanella sp. TaxID=50422 RepID=UPI0040482393